MPNKTEQLADLTREIAEILDQRGVRSFDGHVIVLGYSSKGTIDGVVRHAHDDSEVLKFTLALAL